MTPRKAGVLAMQLPAGAQTWISCGYDSAWTNAEHLAALQVDAIQVSNWQRAGGKKDSLPDPVLRPSQSAEKASKRDRMAERAQAAHARQQAATPQPTARKRDVRGRFVKE